MQKEGKEEEGMRVGGRIQEQTGWGLWAWEGWAETVNVEEGAGDQEETHRVKPCQSARMLEEEGTGGLGRRELQQS